MVECLCAKKSYRTALRRRYDRFHFGYSLAASLTAYCSNYRNLVTNMKTLGKLVVAGIWFAAPFCPGILAQAPPGQPQLAASTAPLLSPDQLQNLVGRIALYPDDLLGLMLPAATTPLDMVKGQRFLEKYKQDKTLKPDPSLPQPVLSLLAYPEVVNLMCDDLDWTESLGHAVMAQQPDVLQAIQVFRRKAQDAGNLKTDDKQVVVEDQDAVKIVPAKQEVVYVPQYQPSSAVVQQAVPAVSYSATAYPNYYVPGAAAAAATTGYVAGVATAYGLNWGAGAVYSAPYASQTAYNQQQRQNYASQSQQSWQNYSSSAQTQRQNSASQNQSARQQTATTNQAQRQQSAGGAQSQAAGNQAQRQQSFSGAQSQAGANQSQRQAAAGAQQGQRQAPEGAQHWQGGGGAGRQGGQNAGARSASAGQFGGRASGGREGGALGGMSSGSRSQSFSKRGGQSMSGMSHGGGGRHR